MARDQRQGLLNILLHFSCSPPSEVPSLRFFRYFRRKEIYSRGASSALTASQTFVVIHLFCKYDAKRHQVLSSRCKGETRIFRVHGGLSSGGRDSSTILKILIDSDR